TGGGGLFNRAGVLFSYNVQTFKDSVLFRFDTIPGFLPCNNPSEDTSTGLLYGMTEFGGSYIGSGVLYCYNPKTGKDSVLINFDTTKGFGPVGSYLFLASNGMFYGMTQYGGDSGKGVVFRYNPKTGQDTILINFNGLNGEVPQCNSLMQATNGLLYGIVAFGGSNNSGVLFSLDPVTNNYTVLVNLNGTSEGTQAYGVLVEQPGTNLLYGMTVRGGTYNMGVLFCYNIATNKDSVLFNFNGTNGSYPFSFPIFIKDTLNGINELTVATNKVIIYPNPNGGKFTVKVMSAELRTKSVLKIYNMLGEQVHQSTLKTSSTQVNLSNEAKGIYLYRIISESGEPISQGKFIIQ
ncbi:MAG TPA: choice-of-anchor tandem repeat GloVer-containing protein, partial [Bacteroidia bacterium]|nr:choice-of-anchor tandem repeat GloVer-containing protein [Bacteroidia bacterium]